VVVYAGHEAIAKIGNGVPEPFPRAARYAAAIPLHIHRAVGRGALWVALHIRGDRIHLFVFWNSKQLREDEDVLDSWRWSPAATRGVSVFLMISACSIAPYLARSGKLGGLGSRDLSLMASLVFATVIGLAVYLAQLLRPGDAERKGRAEIRALELEHQACMGMFQAMVSALAALFLGAVFLPAIAAGPQKALLSDPTLSIAWAFYAFGGCLVWLLRPCLARPSTYGLCSK
jgi:hypothetical protein